MSTNTFRAGLKPLPPDVRDLSLAGIFGVPDLPPVDFIVAEPAFWKDQKDTDFCTAFAGTEVSEDQEMVELCPFFQFAAACMLKGNYDEWGCDLRSACKSHTKVGALAVQDRRREVEGLSRDELANWSLWHPDMFEAAKKHQKGSFFSAVTDSLLNRMDFFDQVRASLWSHRAERCTVLTGTLWHPEWTNAYGGIIPLEYESQGGFGHALKFYGQKTLPGESEPRLVAQLSNGPIGDGGRFYFPRAVVNREFSPFGAFMFKDMPAEEAKKMQKLGICVGDGWFSRVCKTIISYLT